MASNSDKLHFQIVGSIPGSSAFTHPNLLVKSVLALYHLIIHAALRALSLDLRSTSLRPPFG